jgi:hypothetical protein
VEKIHGVQLYLGPDLNLNADDEEPERKKKKKSPLPSPWRADDGTPEASQRSSGGFDRIIESLGKLEFSWLVGRDVSW